MKSNLTKVPLALLSAVFVLGCQDQASGPVGPDDLGPQFAKGGFKGKPPPVLEDLLTLAGGMKTDQDLPVTFSGFNGAQNNDFSQNIVMKFGIDEHTPYPLYDEDAPQSFLAECEIIRGTNGVHHAPDIEEEHANQLLRELEATVESGAFYMETGLVAPDDPVSTGHYVQVKYDHAKGDAFIFLDWGDGPTVRWVSTSETQDEFEFKGPVMVGIKGITGERGKKSNRTIRCGGADDNAVTVIVKRLAA